VLNKIDVPEGRDLADLVRPEIEARGLAVYEVSAATNRRAARAGFAMAGLVAQSPGRAAGAGADSRRDPPGGGERPGVRGRADPGGRLLHPRREAQALGAARPTSPMRRRSATWPTGWLGSVSRKALAEAGATPGDEVLIGEDDDAVVFDWDPTLETAKGTSQARAARTPGCRTGKAELITGRGPGKGADERGRSTAGRYRRRAGDSAARKTSPPHAGRRQGRVVLAHRRGGAIDDERVAALVTAIAARVAAGGQVLLVSSGAIAAGWRRSGCPGGRGTCHPAGGGQRRAGAAHRPVHGGLRAARPGTGQGAAHADDLMRRGHYRNAQRTLTGSSSWEWSR